MDSMHQPHVETELIQDIDRLRGELSLLMKRIEAHVEEQHHHAKATADIDEMQRIVEAEPFRWLGDAKHSLQTGLMFAHRAVTQPTNF